MDQSEPIDQRKPIKSLELKKILPHSYCRQLAWQPRINLRNEAKEISAGNPLIAWLVLIGSSTFSWWSTVIDSIWDFVKLTSGLWNGKIAIWEPFGIEKPKFLTHSDFTNKLPDKPDKPVNLINRLPVNQIMFSPDGRYLASNGYEYEVIIWSTEVIKQIFSHIS